MVKILKKFFQTNLKLISDYFTVIFGTGMSRGLSFITSILVARFMGVEGFGIFSLFFTVMMLFWQLPTIIDGIYVRYVKVESAETKMDYVRATFFLKIIFTVGMSILAYPLSLLLANFVFNKPETVFYVTCAIIAGNFLSMFATLAGIYLAQERYKMFSLYNLAFYVLVFFIVLICIVFSVKFTPFLMTILYSASAVIIGIIGGYAVFKISHPSFPVHMGIVFKMINFGKWLLADSTLSILSGRIDVLFLARLTTYEELGIYSAAVRLAMVASLFSAAVSAIFMPKGCSSLKSKEHLKKYLKETLVVVSGLTVVLGVMIFFTPYFVHLFFSENYNRAILPARILFIESIFTIYYTPFSYIFYATGKSKQLFYMSIVKIFVVAVSLVVLVPKFGSAGAAIAIAVTSLVGLIIAVFVTLRLIKKFTVNLENNDQASSPGGMSL